MKAILATAFVCLLTLTAFAQSALKPLGRMVDLGGHKLHLLCTGRGTPTVVVENGFDEFSFDWTLVRQRVAKFARICTYDRGGYAWSDPGPKPRSYAQLNLELHDALARAGEHSPYVLVGHSFGGPVVRNYALTYPKEVAGLVFADAPSEGHRIVIGKQTMKLSSDAKGAAIPAPREQMSAEDRPEMRKHEANGESPKIEPPYDRLPLDLQRLHLWALSQPATDDAANSERHWSPEYLAKWESTPQAGSLGAMPLVVLSREDGGYPEGLDIPAAQLERERREQQSGLAKLSTRGRHRFIKSGHDMQLEAPDEVSEAIREVMQESKKTEK